MSGFDVDPEAMRSHAHRVMGLSDKAGQATAAAEQVSFSSGMFGSIGSLLVGPFMAPLQGAGVASTEAIQGSLGDTAESIKGMADTFDFVETAVTDFWTNMKGKV